MVFIRGCFEAGFHLLLPGVLPAAPSSAAWSGWGPQDPTAVRYWGKMEGQVSPQQLGQGFPGAVPTSAWPPDKMLVSPFPPPGLICRFI